MGSSTLPNFLEGEGEVVGKLKLGGISEKGRAKRTYMNCQKKKNEYRGIKLEKYLK